MFAPEREKLFARCCHRLGRQKSARDSVVCMRRVKVKKMAEKRKVEREGPDTQEELTTHRQGVMMTIMHVKRNHTDISLLKFPGGGKVWTSFKSELHGILTGGTLSRPPHLLAINDI